MQEHICYIKLLKQDNQRTQAMKTPSKAHFIQVSFNEYTRVLNILKAEQAKSDPQGFHTLSVVCYPFLLGKDQIVSRQDDLGNYYLNKGVYEALNGLAIEEKKRLYMDRRQAA